MRDRGFGVRRIVLTISAMCVATPALAHAGAEQVSGFFNGVTHPFTGVDHLAAFFGVGLLASMIHDKSRWYIPGALLFFMALGGLLGLERPSAVIEFGVVVSVMCVGLAVILLHPGARRLAVTLASVTGLLHGWAHGGEVHASWNGLTFLAGALLSSLALCIAGGVAGHLLARRQVAGRSAGRATGGAIMLAGIATFAN